MRAAPIILMIVLMACAKAPVGSDPAMPNCVFRCHVAVTEITENPELTTVTNTGGDVTSTTTRN